MKITSEQLQRLKPAVFCSDEDLSRVLSRSGLILDDLGHSIALIEAHGDRCFIHCYAGRDICEYARRLADRYRECAFQTLRVGLPRLLASSVDVRPLNPDQHSWTFTRRLENVSFQ